MNIKNNKIAEDFIKREGSPRTLSLSD